jgi:hypothetical protein
MLSRLALPTVAALALAGVAAADSTPVGPLPAGPTTSISTQRGALFAVALPHQPAGRSWRLKSNTHSRVAREVGEANVGTNVVVVFKATARGTTTLSYGATRGETAKAYAAKRFRITVR